MRVLRWLAVRRFSWLDVLVVTVLLFAPGLLMAAFGWPWWAAELLVGACCGALWAGVRIASASQEVTGDRR